ncbi:hypothetical protein [Shewanella mangrovisoli]|uniref:hypothetical protein n=1 Tax=Shewanella mangrovisoli TaxID=2864211 RepID=UPI00370B02B1
MWWRVSWIIVAFWLLSAHFLRYDQLVLTGLFAAAPMGLLIKHSFVIRLLQAILFISVVVVWGTTAIDAVQMRIAQDAPWIRLTIIMGGVMLFSLGAVWSANGIWRNSARYSKTVL